jgi:homoserine O-acetyltransferase/O-succinyltransferase
MKTLIFVILCRALMAQNSVAGERHEFIIANFRTESGVVLPQARIVYGTHGRLNADRSNAVLLPSHYMANFHGYEWLIGPGKALDPRSCFWSRRNCSAMAIPHHQAIHPSRSTARVSR